MSQLINVRASAADRIMLCNYSSIKPTIKLDTSGPWSKFGNAGHEVMEHVVKGDLVYVPDVSGALVKYGVTEQEKALRISLHAGVRAYTQQIRPELNRDTLVSEEREARKLFNKYLLTGHPDLVGMLKDDETLLVVDWKFGDYADHINQLKQYAFIFLQRFPSAKSVLLATYFLRINEYSIKEFTREEIENDWAKEYFIALEGDSLKPCFDACKYCPVLDCEAGNAWARSTVSSLATIDHNQSTAMALAENFEDVKFIERKIIQYKEHMKDYILLNGEPITVKSGKVLDVIQGHRGTLYFWQARQTLHDYFGTADDAELLAKLKDVTTLKKTDLMDMISREAPQGQKGKEKKRISDELENVGALRIKTFDKLALTKPKGVEK